MKQGGPKYTCNEYREEMTLLALNRRLSDKNLPETERREIRREIARLEAAMEMD